MIVVGDGNKAAQAIHHGIGGGIDLMFTRYADANAAVNEQRTENKQQPVKAVNQAHARPDEDSAQNERSHDSPEQDTMLLLLRDGEIVEDHEENEEVIDAKREFEDVSGDKLEAGLMSLP